MSKLPILLTGFISAVAFLISFDGIGAESQPQVKDQMVCHAGKILTVLNKNYSKKSLTCMKRSTQANQDYNNLADIYAEGWIIIDINNANVWLFNK